LSQTELQYLSRALQGWAAIFAEPLLPMVFRIAATVAQFATFEMPLVVALGGLTLLADARDRAGRQRAMFALPFVVLLFAAGMVFARGAGARGYLVYGTSLLFFAASGAALARSCRRWPSKGHAVGVVLVVLSIVWSGAHFAGVLGPAKAYFLGLDH